MIGQLQNPGLWFAGNLMWTRSGTVVATWRLQGLPYGFRPDKDKEAARLLHQMLFRQLNGESQLSGIRTVVDPATVVERMIEGIDLRQAPDWLRECEATLSSLDDIDLGERQYWLSVPLTDRKVVARIRSMLRAAHTSMTDVLGLPRNVPDEPEVQLYLQQAQRIENLIPSMFHAQAATPAQMLWQNIHAQQRGVAMDYEVPPVTADAPKAGVAIPDPLLDEGAQSDDTHRFWHRAQLRRQRVVKIEQPNTPEDVPASYQSLLTVADGPPNGWVFPGAEILGRVDESGMDVDWTIRLQQRSSAEAAQSNRRALNALNEQLEQRDGEVSPNMGQLGLVADMLSEYLGILEADKNEVEIQATFILAVAGPDRDDALDQARALAGYFKQYEYRLEHPVGYQSDLWWATVPGTPFTRTIREFAQITTSYDLSTLVPITSVELGDSRGIRLGRNRSTTGVQNAVLVNPAGYVKRNQNGSIAFSGDQGGGKSATMKAIVGGIMDRGGRFFTMDSSATGEWATFGRTVTDTVVVDLEDPRYSLDPLRIFDAAIAAEITQSFLTSLARIATVSDEGAVLSEIIDNPDYLEQYGITRLGALLDHLEQLTDKPEALRIAKRLRIFASKPLGRVLFDDTLPPLPIDARGIVIRTHRIELPSKDEHLHKHLHDKLDFKKVFGSAIYALGANIVRHISATDHRHLVAFPVDEFHEINASPEALKAVVEILLKGRKEGTVLIAATQDPGAAYEHSSIRGLIPTRIAMRHENKEMAAAALEWVGAEVNDEMIDILTQDTSPVDKVTEEVLPGREGEGVMRDANSNLGLLKVDLPAWPQRRDACLTTPEEIEAQRTTTGAR